VVERWRTERGDDSQERCLELDKRAQRALVLVRQAACCTQAMSPLEYERRFVGLTWGLVAFWSLREGKCVQISRQRICKKSALVEYGRKWVDLTDR
jgi:hypothetical protein